ncbi:hypothetical protein MP228_001602 [Amoeboaphelidium protococcarum]|nr:hypothetical protein MP228_001602 [Amoeboaphelidium protococcarum]
MEYPKRPSTQIHMDRQQLKEIEDKRLDVTTKYTEQELGFTPTRMDMMPPTVLDHIYFKMREHPMIPLTFAVTLGSFVMMARHRKNSAELNRWGRWRISSQAACFVSLFYAMYQDESANRQSSNSNGDGSGGSFGWMPFQWFQGDDKASQDLKKKYFEKH